jgi:hypothetical protein
VARRLIAAMIVGAAMLAASWWVLRPPDIGQAIAFFTAASPTLGAGEAVMAVIAWLAVLIATCGTLVSILRDAWRASLARRPTTYASLILVVGLLLLAVGAVQRSLPSASVCCGSGAANVREAVQLAH